MSKSIETLYQHFIEFGGEEPQELTKEFHKVVESTEYRLEEGILTVDDLADYEAATSRRAFYAGVRAAVSLLIG